MSLKTQAYVADAVGKALVLKEIELPALGPNDVQIEMEFCGLCHTDCSMHNNLWGVTTYPFVPGHEGIGKISHLGTGVTTHKVGQWVGIGFLRGSCGTCRACEQGIENLCVPGYQGTFLGKNAGCWGKRDCNTQGCFSKVMRIDSKFAFIIPASIPAEKAGPLMCAGNTVWEPLFNYVNSTTSVGVLGLGGLGHMAVLFAAKMGATVTVFSRHADKEKRARELGAHKFVVVSDKKQTDAAAGSIDVMIDTTPHSDEDMGAQMSYLAFGGIFCKVGIPNTNFKWNWIPMVFTGRTIATSIVSGSKHTKEMMSFADRNKIIPEVEVVPFTQINEIMASLLKEGNSKFRYVFKW
jgi:D-arabinose 1-dehydrogenase-like Zn-dependent alcohol dehydrogenase